MKTVVGTRFIKGLKGKFTNNKQNQPNSNRECDCVIILCIIYFVIPFKVLC